ncbi:T9SS type A sorting domain-containing protein [Microvirga sp. STR05]|uniref:T9SS type A sorting domain-containing protein n=1 Tax=Hymenobacter duratus TaxID=2771356 RepID=A0ABR8JF68_9BACT|nr:GEVED domain-containing protein [Hymenobacter duratus]MBD2714196.1 T9SS type A sorting domain-containing protein [Hymenobacter duratus]MBR7949098.1 T9SS type A sorting domain-containing protein [Microvirga sp. STR05]
MKKTFYAFALAALGLGTTTQAVAQRQCASMDVLERQLATDPNMAQRLQSIESQTRQFEANPTAQRGTALLGTIPVVVHVLYSNANENISDAQIASQIAVLNEDFRKLNSDVSKTPAAFAGLAADAGLQFVLAKRDPNGNATTGIERKSSTKTTWGTADAMKSTSTGGLNAWPAGQYMNIWVCNIGGGILGYAQFPGGPASTDGVVIGPNYFGRTGYLSAPFDKGRTATHEVGHYLNLRHIWGDANCGNDLVSDTPTQQADNAGCPTFPRRTCGNTTNGDMFMNYMDYTNDACMYMFSTGQSTRMNALFGTGGSRASLLTSLGGTAPGGGTTPPPTTVTYCASKGTNVSYEWIDLVSLGSINRSSASNAGYYDGTALTTTVTAGTSQTISYSAGFASTAYTEYWKVYIDYNQDGDFLDSGETVVSRAGTSSATTLSSTFTVPATAKNGKTRLRVVMSDASATSSCGSFSYGETEDYSITISGGTARTSARLASADYGVYPNPATNVLNIAVPADHDATAVSVRVYDMRGAEQRQLRYSGEGQLDISGLSKGIYMVTITDGQQVSNQRFVKE